MSVDRERTSLNKVSTFSGKEEDFPQWWLGFFTHVTVMGVSEALDSAFDLPTICTGDDLSDEVVDKVKKNAKVINSFVSCFIKSATLMRIIAYAQDDGCPVGRAWKVKERLFQKFAPDDSIASLQLEEELNKLSLGSGKNSMYELFEKVASLQLRFPMHCSDDKLEAAIMKTLPIEYRACAANAKSVHQISSNEAYTFSVFEDAITTFHRQVRGFDAISSSVTSEGDDVEAVLSAVTFNGRCNLCKNYGHKESECMAKELIKPKKFNKSKKKCSHCNKRGHTADKCWKLRPELKPDNSGAGSTALAVIEGDSSYDMVLCSITSDSVSLIDEALEDNNNCGLKIGDKCFNNVSEMISDVDVWICDSGCMNNLTGHKSNLFNVRKSKVSNLMSASGSMNVESIGDLKCYPLNGKPILLTDVRYSSSCPFNLFSATKATDRGWKLTGDDNGYVFEKENIQIAFDIKVKTKSGVLWCKYMSRSSVDVAAVVASKSISINKVHEMFGHINETSCRSIAKHLDVKITKGPMAVCESCAVGKAKQKPLSKNKPKVKATEANERVFIDILTFK